LKIFASDVIMAIVTTAPVAPARPVIIVVSVVTPLIGVIYVREGIVALVAAANVKPVLSAGTK